VFDARADEAENGDDDDERSYGDEQYGGRVEQIGLDHFEHVLVD